MLKYYIIGSLVAFLLLVMMPTSEGALWFNLSYLFVTLVSIFLMRRKVLSKHPLLYFTFPFFALTLGGILASLR